MNDPTDQVIDIGEQKIWLREYRANMGLSHAEVARRLDIKVGTLSQFLSDKGYAGNEQRIADTVWRFRQMQASQAQLQIEAPVIPGYFPTETSIYLEHMLSWAQRGRVVLAAMGAGLGKTRTAQQFTACYPNVFHVEMRRSTGTMNCMLIEVLERMGHKNEAGRSQRLSRMVMDRVKSLENPLIIIDEAQHLEEESIEEIRAWNDAVGVGIALFGNVGVMQRLEGGVRGSAYAQMFSRLSLKRVQMVPTVRDAEALCDAWDIHDEAVAAFVGKIARVPGGLRGATMALELGTVLARGEQAELAICHLQDAWAQLSSRAVSQ